MYRCDKKFHVDAIKPLYNDDKTYGIVVVKGHNSEFYKIHGTKTVLLSKKNVRISKNQKKGGQSAPRFGRIRDGEIKKYISDLSDKCNSYFINNNNLSQIDLLVIVGTGEKKSQLFDKIHPELKDICKVISIPETFTIFQIREITDHLLLNFVIEEEKKIVSEFFSHISKETNLAVYGEKILIEHIKNSNLEKVIVHKDLIKKKKIKIDVLYKKCNAINCEIIEVNGGFEEAEHMLKGFGGLVGISRYSNYIPKF